MEDSVTRFQFPLRIETSAERLKAVEIPKDLITPTHIQIKVEAAPGLKANGMTGLEGAEAITPTQGFFGQGNGSFPPALNPYVQPASRFAQPAFPPAGLLQPSALPATPIQTRASLPGAETGTRLAYGAENDMEVD